MGYLDPPGCNMTQDILFKKSPKFKRLLLRFERIQQRHYGMKLLAYTLINLRAFCGV
jgi:hypothetical protein